MASWKEAGLLTDPGKRPFSEQEIALNPAKQELAGPGLTVGEVLDRPGLAAAALPDVLASPRGRRSLRSIESAIVGQDKEWLVVTDQDGRVLTYAEGEPESVRIPPGQAHLLKGAIVTHNHPGVASFSPNDIAVAMSHDVREIRAVDDLYEYSLKPGRVAWNQVYFDQVALPEYERIEAVVIGKLNDAFFADRINEQTYFNSRDHLIMRKLSRALGLKYRRKKRAASQD